jgi:hypothetical protein
MVDLPGVDTPCVQQRGLKAGHLVSLAGAAAVLVSLWMPWYSVRLPDALRRLFAGEGSGLPPGLKGFTNALAARLPDEIHGSGWQVFSGADVALAAAALLIGALLLASGEAFGPSIKVDRVLSAQAAMLGGGAIGCLVVWKLLQPPVSSEYVRALAGPYVALAGSFCLGLGGWAAARDND